MSDFALLCERYGVPCIDLTAYSPDPDAIKLVPLTIAVRHCALPISRVGDVLTICVSNPLDVTSVDAIRFVTGLKVELVVAPEAALLEAFRRFYQKPKPAGPNFAKLNHGEMAQTIGIGVRQGPQGPSQPLIGVEPCMERVYTEKHAAVFGSQSSALVAAALKNPTIAKSKTCRSDLHHTSYFVGEITPGQTDWDAAISEAMRSLEPPKPQPKKTDLSVLQKAGRRASA